MMNVCCNNATDIHHRGKRLLNARIESIDSLIIDANMTSSMGNFYMQDSSLFFADVYKCIIYEFSINTGKFLGVHYNYGNGPNELSRYLYAYPFENGKGNCFLIDNSLRMYVWNKSEYLLNDKGNIDFGWENQKRNNYESTSIYNIMQFTDFGINLSMVNDSVCLVPLSIVNRYINQIDKSRYIKGHVLGELNLNSMKIERVLGSFPQVYIEKPTPQHEYFDYVLEDGRMYINHAVDSLIYVYNYPNELLYTIGYEATNINREYTVGYDIDFETFNNDIKSCGINTGISYVKESGLLIRTSLLGGKNGLNICLQAYRNDDLILEQVVGTLFSFLGYYDGYYYGVKLLPIETEDEDIKIILYRFNITE